MRKFLIVIVLVALAIGSWRIWQSYSQKTSQIQYRLVKLEQRDLTRSVSATGTMSALVTVAVGSEISGQIKELLADYNDRVRKGQVVAQISPERYQALVREAEAELALTRTRLPIQKAAVERCQANLKNTRALLTAARAQTSKAKAALDNVRRELERNRPLLKKSIISKAVYDAVETALAEAKAQVEYAQSQEEAASSNIISSLAGLSMARAQVKEAAAQVELKMAALDRRRVDLDNTIIRSPIDGVIIDRSVDVGQIVAASLQAPTLFTIAQDLRQMQVSASVDEADIGSIRQGQVARFTVDAFGNRKFEGQVTQIRMAGKTVQNVVTYTVIISVDNSDLSLMPGMTANVEIVIMKKPHVLAVVNAALRFKPSKAESNKLSRTQVSPNNATQAASQSGGKIKTDPEERIQRLTKALDLNQEQQNSLRVAFKEIRKKIKVARQTDKSGSFRMGSLRDRVRKEAHLAIIKVLTPEQRRRYEQFIRGKMKNQTPKGVIWRLNEENRPVPINVKLGVSDGNYTEISGAGIEPGMEVIIGSL